MNFIHVEWSQNKVEQVTIKWDGQDEFKTTLEKSR